MGMNHNINPSSRTVQRGLLCRVFVDHHTSSQSQSALFIETPTFHHRYANLHVVMLSSEHDLKSTSAQYQWLEEDLKAINRKKYPWVVVTAHRPAYNSEDYMGDYETGIHIAREIDSLLKQFRVNLFLAGHYHSYERTCQVFVALLYKRNSRQEFFVFASSR